MVNRILLFVVLGVLAAQAQSLTITAVPNPLVFNTEQGQTVSQTITVTTSDLSPFYLQPETGDFSWLSISIGGGASGASVTLTADPTGLQVGKYTGALIVGSGQQVLRVPVALNIAPTPLTVTPAFLSFSVPGRFGFSVPQSLQVEARPGIPFTVTTSDGDRRFLSVDVSTATTPAVLSVRVNSAGLDAGTYTGTVTLSEGATYQVTIPITVAVGPAATLSFAPGSLNFAYQTGSAAPTTQAVRIGSITASAQNFTVVPFVQGGVPNWITLDHRAGTTPDSVGVGIDPTGLPAGRYTGYLSISNGLTGNTPATLVVLLTVTGNARPVVSAVANSASYQTGLVAPGEIVTLFGTGLGPKTPVTYQLSADGKSIATELATTRVTFDGIPAPILYASDTQTSVQVPYGIKTSSGFTRANTSLAVQYATIASGTATLVPVELAVPGVFTMDASGQGQAIVINQDGTFNGPGNRAARGSVITIFLTGDGATQTKIAEGAIVAAGNGPPYAPPVVPVTATIAGQQATVLYADRSPGSLSGVLQMNLVVPATAQQGPTAPLVISAGTAPAQANLTLGIQ